MWDCCFYLSSQLVHHGSNSSAHISHCTIRVNYACPSSCMQLCVLYGFGFTLWHLCPTCHSEKEAVTVSRSVNVINYVSPSLPIVLICPHTSVNITLPMLYWLCCTILWSYLLTFLMRKPYQVACTGPVVCLKFSVHLTRPLALTLC